MAIEDTANAIQQTDRNIRDNKPVTDADRKINISSYYNQYRWGGPGPTPLPPDALKKLVIDDRTTDARWVASFNGNGRKLGVYRSQIGYYWLLRYDGALSQHWLEHIGTAHDTNERFGK